MINYFLEIKNRICLIILTVISTLLISYLYKETLLFSITQPERLMHKTNFDSAFYFIFTNVTEILSVYIQLISFLSLQAFLLCTLYHFFVFFSPAMFKSEYFFLFNLLKISIIIWFCSVLLSHVLLVPITWDFFFSFQELFSSKFVNLHFEAKLTEYIEFYIYIYYICVIYFQIFTILFFFFSFINNKIKVIKKFRKIYYYFFIVFSTLISPPDLTSQLFISFILICVYEILVFIIITKTILIR